MSKSSEYRAERLKSRRFIYAPNGEARGTLDYIEGEIYVSGEHYWLHTGRGKFYFGYSLRRRLFSKAGIRVRSWKAKEPKPIKPGFYVRYLPSELQDKALFDEPFKSVSNAQSTLRNFNLTVGDEVKVS